MPLHYAARKLAIEHTVREAIGNGATQIVMVSGGFDTLALRLHKEFPDVQFFETDHPATQRTKLSALGKLKNYTQGENLHFLEADLSKCLLEDVLAKDTAYDKEKKTVCIAEGLTMYLDSGQVDQMLQSISNIGCDGSQAIFSIMGSNASKGSSYKSNIAGKIQDASGEDQKFTLPHTEIPEFTRQRGFELNALSSYQNLQDRVSGRKLAANLEWQDENYCVVTKTGKDIPEKNVADIPPIEFEVPEKAKEQPRGRPGRG